ncbi:apical merozoite protein [Hepatocystis sp. ex Piliocolobus tephrosceles]|nr:apical merozoite protein [Hepatocystis sp. ex Piliocolobus tephrosceles]
MNLKYICYGFLVINICSKHLIVESHKIKVNGKGEIKHFTTINNENKVIQNIHGTEHVQFEDNSMSTSDIKADVKLHDNQKVELQKNIEKLKEMNKNLKNTKNSIPVDNIKNGIKSDIHNDIKSDTFNNIKNNMHNEIKSEMNNDIKSGMHKNITSGMFNDKNGVTGKRIDNSLKQYIMEEIKNNNVHKNVKKSTDELKQLEQDSKKLQHDISEWLKSVNNIDEKNDKLKKIKTELLNNITSLNDTLVEEMENIKNIKKLQNEQNEIFNESWDYFFPSKSENNFIEQKKLKNSDIINYLKKYNEQEKETNSDTQVNKQENVNDNLYSGIPNILFNISVLVFPVIIMLLL